MKYEYVKTWKALLACIVMYVGGMFVGYFILIHPPAVC